MKVSQIKKQSRKIIKGSIKTSSKFLVVFIVGIFLFSVLPYLVNYYFQKNSAAVILLLVFILVLGFVCLSSFKTSSKAWFMFYNKKKRGAKSVYWFKPSKAAECTGIYISLFFRKLMWTLTFLSPGGLIIVSAVIIALNGGVEFNLFATWIVGGTMLLLTGICFLYFYLQRYFLVPYIKTSNPSMKKREIIAKSKELMSDESGKAALLKISFLPWFLLSLTVIPAFYVWSYYSQSCAVMANEIYRKESQKNTGPDMQ